MGIRNLEVRNSDDIIAIFDIKWVKQRLYIRSYGLAETRNFNFEFTERDGPYLWLSLYVTTTLGGSSGKMIPR